MKYQIDNLFRNKLQDLKVEYKPEYWNEMEKMLAEKPSGAAISTGVGTGLSSIFFKAAIIISATAIVATLCYFCLSPIDSNNKASNANQPTSNSIATQKNLNEISKEINTNTENKILNQAENNRNQSIITPIFSPAHLPYSISIIEFLNWQEAKNNCFSIAYKPFNINDYKLEIEDEIIVQENISEVSAIENKFILPKTIEKSIEPKNIKPMEKPVKHVFKKKGILYFLGLKK